jgi:hypothetical protein
MSSMNVFESSLLCYRWNRLGLIRNTFPKRNNNSAVIDLRKWSNVRRV